MGIIYTCPVCQGSGWEISYKSAVGYRAPVAFAKRCTACNGGKIRNAEERRERANIPHAFYNSYLSDFNWNIYRDANGNILDLTEHRKYIESFLDNYTNWKRKGMGLYIWSKTKGSGKTFLASCICNELIKRYGLNTKFVSASELISLQKNAQANSGDSYSRDPIGILCRCDILVIDDLGQNLSGSSWVEDILFQITDQRMNNRLVTIFTSNNKVSGLKFNSDQVPDRINRISQNIPLPEYCVRSMESNTVKKELFKELGLI